MEENTLEKIMGPKRTAVSGLNDPFKKECLKNISIFADRSMFSPYYFSFSGSVEFQNGNTKGEQRFEGSSLDDIYNKIYEFCENL